MRRIVIAAMGTVSGLVLLFSYHTSTNSSSGTAAAPIGGSTGDGTPATTPEPSSTASSTASGTSSSDSTGSGSSSSSTSSSGTGSSSSKSGTYTGTAADTRWGVVQVQITVQNGKITKSVALQYPQGNGRDIEINNYALPQLAQEVVSQQSANIDAISGATVTSDGYIQSLQAAIDQAHL